MMKEITDMPYHEFIMMKLMEKVGLELFWAAWGGVYAAPTIGTPNPSATWVDVLDGFINLLQTEVTASAIPVVATGTLTSSNIVSKLELVGNELGGVTTDGTGVMFVSRKAYRLYAQSDNTVGRFISFRELDGPITLRGTGIKVIECPALDKAGKPNAIIATTMNNMFMGTDVLDSRNQIEIQKYERSIKVLIDGTWGSQIALVDKVNNPIVVNDQI
jgi:hypothetical protein